MKNIILITSKQLCEVKRALKLSKSDTIKSNLLINFFSRTNKIEFNIDDNIDDITDFEDLKLNLNDIKLRNDISEINKLLNKKENKSKIKPAYILQKNSNGVISMPKSKQKIHFSEDKSIFLYECKLNKEKFRIKNFIQAVLDEVIGILDNETYKFTLLVHRDDIGVSTSNDWANTALIEKNESIESFPKQEIDWAINNCFSFSHQKKSSTIFDFITSPLTPELNKTSGDLLYNKVENYFNNRAKFVKDELDFFTHFDKDAKQKFKALKDNLESNFTNSKIF